MGDEFIGIKALNTDLYGVISMKDRATNSSKRIKPYLVLNDFKYREHAWVFPFNA